MSQKIDPVTFEVLRNVFEYSCARMTDVLQRSSFSPILADMVDFSNAIYDADLKLLSQDANCPVHLAAMKFQRRSYRRKVSDRVDERRAMSTSITTHTRAGRISTTSPFILPIFHGDSLLGFAVSRGHWMDLGGGAAGGQSFGTHIAGEGLRLPPLKLYENYEVNQDLLEIILNNTRTPALRQRRLAGAFRLPESR